MDAMLKDFDHIRDRLVILKLLQTLLHSVEFLENEGILDRDEKYRSRFERIFHKFRSKMAMESTAVSTKEVAEAPSMSSSSSLSRIDALKRRAIPAMKSKIIFRKQAVSKRVKVGKLKEGQCGESKERESDYQQKKDGDKKVIFKHFNKRSMKIVDCIVNGDEASLAQHANPVSTKEAKRRDAVNHNARKSAIPPPPVLKPLKSNLSTKNKENAISTKGADPKPVDLSILNDTLLSIGSVLENEDSAHNATDQIIPSTDFEDDIPLNPYGSTSNDERRPRDHGYAEPDGLPSPRQWPPQGLVPY